MTTGCRVSGQKAFTRIAARALIFSQVLAPLPLVADTRDGGHRSERAPRQVAGRSRVEQVAMGERNRRPSARITSNLSASGGPPVVVNRTVPRLEAVPLLPTFPQAADDEFFRARAFDEPLVPMDSPA